VQQAHCGAQQSPLNPWVHRAMLKHIAVKKMLIFISQLPCKELRALLTRRRPPKEIGRSAIIRHLPRVLPWVRTNLGGLASRPSSSLGSLGFGIRTVEPF
jgi:hypothetical protein